MCLKTTVAMVSGAISKTNPNKNYEYLSSIVSQLGAVNLIVTGELFLARDESSYETSEFWGELEACLKKIADLAVEKELAICVGYPHRENEKIYIRQSVFFSDKPPYHYDKSHLGRRERAIYTSGDQIGLFELNGIYYGLQLCIESHIPDLSRIQKEEGASVILAPFNTPYSCEKRLVNWRKYVGARAYDYNMPILCQNTGGALMAVDGHGNILKVSAKTISYEVIKIDETFYNTTVDYMFYRRPELYKKYEKA